MMTLDELKHEIREKVFKRASPDIHIARRGVFEQHGSQWFFDFRSVAFDAKWLECFAEQFWHTYGDAYPFQVGGLESASLPLMTAVALKGHADSKAIHSFFIRKSRKRDGFMRMFEGTMGDEPVIIVDDAMNSGQSIERQVRALEEMGKKVTDVFVMLRFRDKLAYKFLNERGIRITSLFTLEDFGLPLLSAVSPEVAQDYFTRLWRFQAGEPSFNLILEKSAPVLDSSHVYMGSDDGFLYALQQKTGDVSWKCAIGPHPKGKGILSSPAIHKGRVYFGGYDGTAYALNAKTGERVWAFAEADWIGSSPSLAPDRGLLFIGVEYSFPWRRGGIAALRLDTGEKVWSSSMRSFVHSSPLYIPEEDMVVVGNNDGEVHAFRAKTGEKLWNFKTDGEIRASFAYDAKRRLILFGSWDGKLYALNALDGSCSFSFETATPTFSTPLIYKDTVLFASLDKFLYAIHLDTGAVKWKFQTGGRIFGSPILAEDSVWIGSNDAKLYELDPETGELRTYFQAVERIVNAIAYNPSTRRFFVPTVANELYCIERKK